MPEESDVTTDGCTGEKVDEQHKGMNHKHASLFQTARFSGNCSSRTARECWKRAGKAQAGELERDSGIKGNGSSR